MLDVPSNIKKRKDPNEAKKEKLLTFWNILFGHFKIFGIMVMILAAWTSVIFEGQVALIVTGITNGLSLLIAIPSIFMRFGMGVPKVALQDNGLW